MATYGQTGTRPLADAESADLVQYPEIVVMAQGDKKDPVLTFNLNETHVSVDAPAAVRQLALQGVGGGFF